MSKSNIEWTEATWNPVVGCSILSPGCTHCYAMGMAARIEAISLEARETERCEGKKKPHAPQYDGTTKKVNGHAVWTGKLAMAGDNILLQPLKRKKPTTYFVNSMGDLFHEDCPDEWIDKVFAVMAMSPQHTFQVLTKRAKRMREYCSNARVRAPGFVEHACGIAQKIPGLDTNSMRYLNIVSGVGAVYPLPNVWLGVSTERQQEADERIPELLHTPAAVRFISAEPLLGPIDLASLSVGHDLKWNSLGGRGRKNGLDWVIVGGESGSDARPMHPEWARSLRVQCEAAGVPFFFKQWGEWISFYDRDRDDPDWRNLPTPSIDNQMGRGATRWHNLAGGIGFHGERLVAMRNVGKKAAGRALDGIEYNQMPGAL
jgi:protein gp37